MPDHVLVSEAPFHTMQGEGALCGQISSFIRFSGCSYRCKWCDSMHAVDPVQIRQTARHLTAEEIMAEVEKLPRAPWMTLTGGDPVAWNLERLVWALKLQGYKVAVETQGALWREWLMECDLVTCSPKGPSSGMSHRLDLAVLQRYWARLGSKMVLKVVVFNRADLDFAERMRRLLPYARLFLSSGTPLANPEVNDSDAVLRGFRKLVADVLARPSLHEATLSPQMHVLVWGRATGH